MSLGRAQAGLCRALLSACLTGVPLCGHAQVWAHVDEQGLVHFASAKVDERYELFYRGTPSPRDPSALSRSSTAGIPSSTSQIDSGWETPFLTDTADPSTGAVVAPPALLAFFQVFPPYKAVRHHIREAGQTHGVAPELLQAVIAAESGFDPKAVSHRGAVGLMQIMPESARAFGVQPRGRRSVEDLLTDPRLNIQTGARILSRLMSRFNGDLQLVLAAYNAGEGAVLRAGRQVPPYPETIRYVQTVVQLYEFLQPPKALQPVQAARLPPHAPCGEEPKRRCVRARQGLR